MSAQCRFCGHPLTRTFADLGMSPLSNAYLREDQLTRMEPFYPLHARVCDVCLLVQVDEYQSPEDIFTDYAYFSSYSQTWLDHAKRYTDHIVDRFDLDPSRRVIEIASNDGYLLQYFVTKGIPVLGIEPAANVAEMAVQRGIPTVVDFFGTELAQRLTKRNQSGDLILGNNVLAHVPDINDFVAGLKMLLNARGVITMEFPHLLKLIQDNQFDTIYHEHFSYFSLTTVERVFAAHALTIFDVEQLPTHGGSLRIFACHTEDSTRSIADRVIELRALEREAGLTDPTTYERFAERIKETKRRILQFLIQLKMAKKTIVGYGAPAKGNTLLNYCGIRNDFIDYTTDANPHKQGRFLPGTHIPILHPDAIFDTRPDYILILPWNIKEEIILQLHQVRDWGGQFIVPIPDIEVVT